jgi:Ca-activated chloride channel family protein
MRVTAGGAQDAKFARGEISGGRIPHPSSITAEGLLGEHDLTLPTTTACEQLLCLVGEAAVANFPTLPHARYVVALGFASNIEEKTWDRKPLNLIAVVDKSGSMSGQPLELVKRSLRGLVANLRPSDQLGIVLYGDRAHVHLAPLRATSINVERLFRSVDAIESAGSTNMEEGLEIGYALARETKGRFRGITRLALFTDERPNVGHTDAGSFIGMAREASSEGIGLTTIGVGVQYDSGLATELSSTRGGNLFFLDGPEAADSLFTAELDYMVSELAHDLTITLRPGSGHRIAGIYGVPGEVLGWHEASAVTVTIPTVFLSREGGGLFVSLARDEPFADLPEQPLPAGAWLLDVAHTYVPLGERVPETGSLVVGGPAGAPSEALALGRALVDEYLSLRAATAAHHIDNDQQRAFEIVRDLDRRLTLADERTRRSELTEERETVGMLLEKLAFLSGNTVEVSGNFGSPLWGHWQVAALGEGGSGLWAVGDRLLFTPDNEVVSLVQEAGHTGYIVRDRQEYLLTRRQISFSDEDLKAAYRIHADQLTLRFEDEGSFELVRVAALAP